MEHPRDGREDWAEGTPDTYALRRRVLLTGVLTLALFFTAAYVVTALDVSGLWLLLALAVVWVVVVRPLMQPVREATALRRRLAHQAYLDQRHEQQQEDRP